MALYHHGTETYETRIGKMADRLRTKFDKTIADGRIQAQAVLEQLDRDQPRDRVVQGRALKFVPVADGVEVSIGDTGQERIHDNALTQFADRGKMSVNYVRALQKEGQHDWARELLAHNLTELFHRGPGNKRHLTRSVQGETRACLSDRYRRLDSRPLFAAFHEIAIRQFGAVPTRAYALATKTAVRVVLPVIFEPIPNEPMLYGLEWHNSDFGHGKHSLRAFLHRPYCTNEMTTDDTLSQVHLGGKLAENVEFSQHTYELDQKTSVSALRDVVKGLLMPARIDETMRLVARADEEKVSAHKVAEYLKANFGKADAQAITEAFTSADVENLPPGQSAWRLSNAISFVATQTEDKYKALELERAAGAIMTKLRKAA